MPGSPDPSSPKLTPEHITRVLERAPIAHWRVELDAELEPDGTCSFSVHCQPAPRGFHDIMFSGYRNVLTGAWKDLSLLAVPSSIPKGDYDDAAEYRAFIESEQSFLRGPWVERLFEALGPKIAKANETEASSGLDGLRGPGRGGG